MPSTEQIVASIFKGNWTLLSNQSLSKIDKGHFPGVYLIAWSSDNLDNKPIIPTDVFYVGMCNAQDGVKARVRKFFNATQKSGYKHSGGNRFRTTNSITPYRQIPDGTTCNFYFHATAVECDVNKQTRTEKDLRIMGNICQLEYWLLAHIKSTTGQEPVLNQK